MYWAPYFLPFFACNANLLEDIVYIQILQMWQDIIYKLETWPKTNDMLMHFLWSDQ